MILDENDEPLCDGGDDYCQVGLCGYCWNEEWEEEENA